MVWVGVPPDTAAGRLCRRSLSSSDPIPASGRFRRGNRRDSLREEEIELRIGSSDRDDAREDSAAASDPD